MILRKLVSAALLVAAMATGSAAEDNPGDFDFYVLSLAWSPSYCEAEGGTRGMQCDGRRRFAFVLHGLWPQYERGWPENCDVGGEEPSRRQVDAMLPIMPSPGLVRHEWRRHGSCSGLGVDTYFDLMTNAFGAVSIPPALRHIEDYTMVEPEAVETAFRAANPGLPADGIAVTCDDRRLREIRLCMTRDLAFRSCPEVDRRDCRQNRVVMPPVR